MSAEARGALRVVVFDLFHTLVSPEAIYPTAYLRSDRVADALGLDAAEFLRWWAVTKGERNRHRTPTVAERVRSHCQDVGRRVSAREVERALYEGDRYHDEALLNPAPEVMRTLKRLREGGYRVGVLSNTDEHESRKWPGSPIAREVDVAHLSIDTGRVKPEPSAFLELLRALGKASPGTAAYVGDGESHELEAAKRLGFRRVVFMRGYVRDTGFQTPANLEAFAREADVVIDRIEQLPSVLVG